MRDTERAKPLSYRIQDYRNTIQIANGQTAGSDVIQGLVGLNGLLRSLTIAAPVMTGTSYTVTIQNSSGAVIFTKTALAVNSTSLINKDENNNTLQIPIAAVNNGAWLTITSNATEGAPRTFNFEALLQR